MGCTKRVSWHQRSLPCVRQKNIRTLDATPNTHTHTHTYNQTQASAVRCFCSYPQTTFVRPLPSRKQKDAESERSNLLHIFNLQQSAIPGCTSKVSSKVRRGTDAPTFHINRGYLLHTLTPSRIKDTSFIVLDTKRMWISIALASHRRYVRTLAGTQTHAHLLYST